MKIYSCVLLLALFELTITVSTAPTSKTDEIQHKLTKRNFVPNRFDIVDNELKHSIQNEVRNALRKNFVPNNPLLEDSKWGRSSPQRYPENQPTKIYGMEYDQINPSRSDPGYLVLDLKKLAQGHLKFHEQKFDGTRKSTPAKNGAASQWAKNSQNNQMTVPLNNGGYQRQQYQNYQQPTQQQQYGQQQQQYYQQQQPPPQQQQPQQYQQQQQQPQQQPQQLQQQQPQQQTTQNYQQTYNTMNSAQQAPQYTAAQG